MYALSEKAYFAVLVRFRKHDLSSSQEIKTPHTLSRDEAMIA
jgi:hypothetical protein